MNQIPTLLFDIESYICAIVIARTKCCISVDMTKVKIWYDNGKNCGHALIKMPPFIELKVFYLQWKFKVVLYQNKIKWKWLKSLLEKTVTAI